MKTSSQQDDNDGPIRVLPLPQHASLNQQQQESFFSIPNNIRVNTDNSLHRPKQQQAEAVPLPLRAADGSARNYYFITPAPTTTASNYMYYSDNAAANNNNNGSSLQDTTGVWNYLSIVFALLVLWVFSLMLPKGARKQFFGSMPRRYNRRRYAPSEVAELSTLSGIDDSVDDSILQEVEKRRISSAHYSSASQMQHINGNGRSIATTNADANNNNASQLNSSRLSEAGSETGSVFLRPMPRSASKYSRNTSYYSNASSSYISSAMRPYPAGGPPPPSPGHPAIQRLPPTKILNETMQRLKSRGIRLVAHGVASESKRVWIRFEEDTTSLCWQTEFARKVPNQSGEFSMVMMRGALHRIALPNILYVDVGKKTQALKKPENKSVPDQVCFSLLTQNGSLDLQANSRLERDALVSAFSMILDEVHTQDWRSLYAESPETSVVQSSCTGSDLHAVEF